jgi:hypothetical protein
MILTSATVMTLRTCLAAHRKGFSDVIPSREALAPISVSLVSRTRPICSYPYLAPKCAH